MPIRELTMIPPPDPRSLRSSLACAGPSRSTRASLRSLEWRSEAGVGLVEALTASIIFLIVSAATVGLLIGAVKGNAASQRVAYATEAAQTQIEKIRALPYLEVGTNPGSPAGSVTPSVTAASLGFANLNATVTTHISYVGDGVPGGYNQTTDYKKVTVTVASGSTQLAQDVTFIAPDTSADQGTLGQASITLNVTDMGYGRAGQPASGVAISLLNGPSSPLSDQTDASGTVTFAGLTYNSSGSYSISLPAGYTLLSGQTSVALAAGQDYSGALNVEQYATINICAPACSPTTGYTGTATVIVTPQSGSPQTYSGVSFTNGAASIGSIVPGTSYSVSMTTASGLVGTAALQAVPNAYPTDLTSTYTVALVTPPAASIALASTSNTKAATVTWNVTFNTNVIGVSTSNFSLTGTATSGASLSAPTGTGSSWTVTATTAGDGTLGLSLSNISGIYDTYGNALSGTAAGPSYTIDKTAPTVVITAPVALSTTGPTPTLSGTAGNAANGTDGTSITINIYPFPQTSGTPTQTATATRAGTTWTTTASSIAAGTYNAIATQSDQAGNVGTSGTVKFTVSTTPLLTNVNSSLADGSYKAGQLVPINVTFSMPVNVTGTPTLTLGTTPSRTASYASGTGTATLTFNYTVLAGDTSADLDYASTAALALAGGTIKSAADGTNASLTLPSPGTSGSLGSNDSIVIDTTNPTVTLTAPATASSGNDTTPTLSGAAGSATGDSTTVTVKIYNGATLVQTLTPTRAGAAWTTTAAALAQGTYTATATQTDAAGNTGTSTTNTFTIDTAAPAVTLTNPVTASHTNDTTPTLSGAAGTATGDSTTVTVKIYNGATLVQTLTPAAVGATWTTTAAALADGTYTATATQTDNAGNTGTSSTNTFTVDTVAPAVTLTVPATASYDNDTTPTLSGAAGNAAGDSTPITVKIYNGATLVQTLTPNRTFATWTTTATALAQGTYTATATQTDSAGNTGTSSTNTFTVDTTVPTASSISTAPNPQDGKPDWSSPNHDTITLTYSEAMDPNVISSGWNGSTPLAVTASFTVPGHTQLAIRNAANTATLPLGTIDLGDTSSHYVSSGTVTEGASIVMSGNQIIITINSTNGALNTHGGATTLVWTPSGLATDLAGNACTTATVSSTSKVNF